MTTPQYIQIGLLNMYLILAVGFGCQKKTWPLAIYYGGCFVKDSAVYLLAFLERWFA